MKTVFHVSEAEKWEQAAANAANLAAFCRERALECEIELVANGGAVRALTRAGGASLGLERTLEALADSGAVIAACNNTLAGMGIPAEELCPWVTVVPAGVAELSQKQAEGFAYIKP